MRVSRSQRREKYGVCVESEGCLFECVCVCRMCVATPQ